MIPASRAAWSLLDDYAGPRPDPSQRLISVTSLIAPARIVRLTALHRAELPPDDPGSDTWKLLGTAVHAALEKAADHADPPALLIERREETTIPVDGISWTISGQIDVLESDGTLWDYKVTSAWSVSDGRQVKGEWAAQLNILKWLLERTGAAPKGLIRSVGVWAILRDWSASQAARDDNYPQSQEQAIPLPIWGDDETYQFILERLRAHEAARTALPECSAPERWARGGGYAVLRSVKAPRAERIFDRREDAERYRDEILSGKGLIEERHGKSVRCAQYCRVRDFCSQFKNSLDTR